MSESVIERQTIFISHALPEDVEVAMWVAAKLRNEGYDAWCEVEQVHGGEHFWKEIEPIIRDRAAKFILLASKISVAKQGVRDEWDFARTVARDFQLKDFIIPVNLDGVSPSSIMGLTGLAMISFDASWAHGIKAILKKLHKDGVPKSKTATPLSAAHWYFGQFASRNTALKKSEKLFSNWVALPELPRHLYFHRYSNDAQARAVVRHLRALGSFPVVRHDAYVIAFEHQLPPLLLTDVGEGIFDPVEVKTQQKIAVETRLIRSRRYQSAEFPQKQDSSNLLVELLKQAMHEFLLSRGLKTYEMANQRLCYYYPRHEGNDHKTKYLYEGKTRTKQLTGIYYQEDYWHFGISFNPRIRPELLYAFKSRVVFSADGENIWKENKRLVSARRDKGKRWYNAEWRDLLLAFLGSLTDNQVTFDVPVTSTHQLKLSTEPIVFISDTGYQDPADQARLTPIDDFDNEEPDDLDEVEFDADAALSGLIDDDSTPN